MGKGHSELISFKIRLQTAVVFLITYGLSLAQVLVVSPNCGTPGQAGIKITGSGWAEPQPVCEYIFYFDGVEVAPRQPDGLYGPPNQTFTVPPAATVGDHIVKVELRLMDGTLLQCRQTNFKVVAAVKDPWAGNVSTPGGDCIKLKFDPTDVCDVTPCEKIYFIQTINMQGEKADASTRSLTFAEQNFSNAADYQTDVDNTNSTVDRIWGKKVPYYGIPPGAATPGKQGTTPVPAEMSDCPKRSGTSYPADIVKIILDFEVNVFCGEGDNQGEFVGQITWRWTRTKAGVVSVTNTPPTRAMPTADFTAALTKWNSNPKHPFTLPTPKPPTKGGEPCK